MRVAAKTKNRIILEVTSLELDADNFDDIWDKIRTVYPLSKYPHVSINSDPKNDEIIFFELIQKQKSDENF